VVRHHRFNSSIGHDFDVCVIRDVSADCFTADRSAVIGLSIFPVFTTATIGSSGSSRFPGDLNRPGRGRGFSDYSGYGETGGTAKFIVN
jgi:hypothetical protein